MEKIKEALAKAKLQQSTPTRTSNVIKKQKVNAIVVDESNDIGNINYSDSLVLKLDDAHLENNRIVSQLSKDASSAVFDTLRTQILQKMEENNWQTLAVVSPTPESGKTLISINLAISIAHQPQKTALLVDFDLRRPKVATYLGIKTGKSMNEFLDDSAQLEEVMINPSIPRLIVMPTMKPITRSSEVLSSNKVRGLIKELKERYDSRIIIFDLPPLLSSDDAMVLLPQVDCVLVVIADGVSTEEEIEQALGFVPQENLIGVVLNKVDIEHKAYYY